MSETKSVKNYIESLTGLVSVGQHFLITYTWCGKVETKIGAYQSHDSKGISLRMRENHSQILPLEVISEIILLSPASVAERMNELLEEKKRLQ